MVWGPQASHFPTKIQSKNQPFSETPSWTFDFWCDVVPNCSILGPPWCQLGLKWRPKSPKWRQKPEIYEKCLVHWNQLAPKVFFGALLGITLIDFGWILNEFWWISVTFYLTLDAFLATKFEDRHSCLERSELTENIKNTQISADICKNRTQTKTQTSNLRLQICKLQNATSYNKRRAPK